MPEAMKIQFLTGQPYGPEVIGPVICSVFLASQRQRHRTDAHGSGGGGTLPGESQWRASETSGSLSEVFARPQRA